MTNLWVMSDLHQEHASNCFDVAAHAPDSFDALVVAGDVNTPGTRAIDWLADRFPGTPVVYVMGNHDLYRDGSDDSYTFADMYARSQDYAARRGINLLVDSSVTIAGVRFVGGSLWTDMRYGAYNLQHAYATARRGMNDYHRIRRRPSGRHRHMTVDDTVQMHRATKAYVDAALAVPFDGPSIVVTHHAPSPNSLVDPHMDLAWTYVSDLGDLISARQPDLWLHGHLHNHSDYRIGRTRVVANPRAHVEESATAGFVPDMTVTL